jgi:hypothetical protein
VALIFGCLHSSKVSHRCLYVNYIDVLAYFLVVSVGVLCRIVTTVMVWYGGVVLQGTVGCWLCEGVVLVWGPWGGPSKSC